MAGAKTFEELLAWQAARVLVKSVYDYSRKSLRGEAGLRSQLCRAAVSVMSNIAEGFTRKGDKEFARYLDISRGSAAEVQSLLYVALDAGLLPNDQFQMMMKHCQLCHSRVAGLTAYLRGKDAPQDEPPAVLPGEPPCSNADRGPRTADGQLSSARRGAR
jgi:four helix bundle protein